MTKPLLLGAHNLATHDTGFYRLEPGAAAPKMLLMGARTYSAPTKAKDADVYLLTVQTFAQFPDYYVTGPDFHELKRVTDINPKVKEYNWGKAELVSYTTADGDRLSGMLVKPENFDPSKKYPMIVYIYERESQNLHTFRVPNVTRGQVINPTFYASNGYLVLMPDIAYKIGYPGAERDQVRAPGDPGGGGQGIREREGDRHQRPVVGRVPDRVHGDADQPVQGGGGRRSGVEHGQRVRRHPLGHRPAAAVPVRETQSRIGATLWEAPLKFIENSPVFMADRVQTPLLMIHNDQDDAVPWYQGIEYFLALRRLGKEAYLLNYNGEPHNLANRRAARDFSVRMFQFFEHHLRDKPAPEWMEKGVPYLDRDKEKEQIKKALGGK